MFHIWRDKWARLFYALLELGLSDYIFTIQKYDAERFGHCHNWKNEGCQKKIVFSILKIYETRTKKHPLQNKESELLILCKISPRSETGPSPIAQFECRPLVDFTNKIASLK